MTFVIIFVSNIIVGSLGLVVGYVLRILEEKENRK